MKTRNGKIARLPRDLRDQLNERLDNGQTEAVILPWLNALPVTQAALAAEFAGRPVNQQNLSNWRQGGYQQWLKEQEQRRLVRASVCDARDLASQPGALALADNVSTVLLAQLALSAHQAQQEIVDPSARCERLRELLHTVGQVRRENYLSGRLALDREIQALEFETR